MSKLREGAQFLLKGYASSMLGWRLFTSSINLWISFSPCVHINKTPSIYRYSYRGFSPIEICHCVDWELILKFIHVYASIGRDVVCSYCCSWYLHFNLTIKFKMIIPQNKLTHFDKVWRSIYFGFFFDLKCF